MCKKRKIITITVLFVLALAVSYLQWGREIDVAGSMGTSSENFHEEHVTFTFTQITWFVITEFIIILFGDIPPLSMIEGAFLKYFGIPVALTWFMSQKTFDGKKPYSFLKSQITYALRPKITYAGKAVKLHKQTLNETITAVRSVNYVPDKIY